jgi:hypothetical protein
MLGTFCCYQYISELSREGLPIVTTVPCPTNAITYLPFLLTIGNCDDITDTFVAENDWDWVAEAAMLGHGV